MCHPDTKQINRWRLRAPEQEHVEITRFLLVDSKVKTLWSGFALRRALDGSSQGNRMESHVVRVSDFEHVYFQIEAGGFTMAKIGAIMVHTKCSWELRTFDQ